MQLLITVRKPLNWRLRHSNSNKPPPLPAKPRPFLTHGSDMRDKLKSANKRSSLRTSLPRSQRSLRTPRSSNKSCNRALQMLRVSA